MNIWFSSVAVCLIVASLVYISFENSLDNAFVFDDHLAITNNHDVKDPSSHRIWSDDIWGKELSAHDSHKSFRPLLIWMFRTLWSISSEARWFRQVSLVAHVVATWLFFHLAHLIWARFDLSLAATLLFSVHPIHVESVAAVVNMAEAFSAVFIMLSYMLFLRSTRTAKTTKSTLSYWIGETGKVLLWVIFVILASLFKETGITSCLLVVAKTAMDFVLWQIKTKRNNSNNSIEHAKSNAHSKMVGNESPVVQIYTLYTLTALFMTYLYLSFRALMTSPQRDQILSDLHSTLYHLLLKPIMEQQTESYLNSSQLLRKAENPFALLTGWEKIYSSMYLHFLYMSKLVYPSTQSPEYAFDCIPKVSTVEDPRFWYSVAMYGTLVLVGLVGLYCAVVGGGCDGGVSNDEAASRVAQVTPTEAVVSGSSDILKSNDTDNETSAVDEPPTVSASATTPLSTSSNSVHPQAQDSEVSVPSTIPSDALLHSLMLLVVFFLPASGLVFRLGTLLAERLMYTPSIGSCMLIVAVVYWVCSTAAAVVCWLLSLDRNYNNPVSGIDANQSNGTKSTATGTSAHRSCRAWLAQILFWPCVLALVMLYTQRTRTCNTVWKDDNTLFLESLAVCPHSAKMNLQVSKVYSQRGDFQSARRHLEAAQRIDPDFCDTGYQDVVITMAVAAAQGQRNSLDVAAEKAVKNLHCIYTNTATITLLNHLWSSQLQSVQATGNKAAIAQELEKQGAIALGGDVQFLAAQKFVEAGSIAFDASLVDRAVKLVTKAEKIVLSLEAAHRNGTETEEGLELNAEVRCRIFTLSGLFRTSQLQTLAQKRATQSAKPTKGDKKKNKSKPPTKEADDKKMEKSTAKLTQRTRDLLHRAVFTDCLQAAVQLPPLQPGHEGQSNSVVVEHLPLAINHLVSMWTLQMNSHQETETGPAIAADASVQPHALETYAQDLTAVFYIASLLQQRLSLVASPDHAHVVTSTASSTSAQHTKVTELCVVLQKLALNAYHLAGTKYLHQQDLPGAVHSFQRGLLVHSASHTTRVMDYKYGRTSMDRREQGPMPVVTLQDFRNVTLSAETCTSLHWLTETIASTPDFQHNAGLVQEVQLYIKSLIKCISKKIYASPKLSVPQLKGVLKSITSAKDSEILVNAQ